MSLDVARARADTPGTESVAHLNNAGAALPPTPVLDAVVEHLRREAEIGGYEAAAEREDRVEHTYDAVARLIGAERDEIAIVENATRAWDMAFYSLRLREGDRILTTPPSTPATTSRCGRSPTAPAPPSWWCRTTSTARSTSTASRACSTSA